MDLQGPQQQFGTGHQRRRRREPQHGHRAASVPHSDTPVGPVDHPLLVGCGEPAAHEVWRGPASGDVPSEFQLRREQLTFFVQGSEGGEDVVGCFSNCGQYKFQGQLTGACPAGFRCAGEPPSDCNPDINTEAGASVTTGSRSAPPCPKATRSTSTVDTCSTNADCPQHGVCWNNGNPRSAVCRAQRIQQAAGLFARRLHQSVLAKDQLPASVQALQRAHQCDRIARTIASATIRSTR